MVYILNISIYDFVIKGILEVDKNVEINFMISFLSSVADLVHS